MVLDTSDHCNEALEMAFRTTRRRADMSRQAMQTTRIRMGSFSEDGELDEELLTKKYDY